MIKENSIQNLVDNDSIIFLSDTCLLSQTTISDIKEALEEESKGSDLSLENVNNIYSIFIELSQNMMNYFKINNLDNSEFKNIIFIAKDDNGIYHIHSQNIVFKKDKEQLQSKLDYLLCTSKDEVQKEYRILKRNRDVVGTGFYEIIKRSSYVEYEFHNVNDREFAFHFEVTV